MEIVYILLIYALFRSDLFGQCRRWIFSNIGIYLDINSNEFLPNLPPNSPKRNNQVKGNCSWQQKSDMDTWSFRISISQLIITA